MAKSKILEQYVDLKTEWTIFELVDTLEIFIRLKFPAIKSLHAFIMDDDKISVRFVEDKDHPRKVVEEEVNNLLNEVKKNAKYK